MKKTQVVVSVIVVMALSVGCSTALTTASNEGDLKSIEKLLDSGANINESGVHGPPLSYAVGACRVDAASYLIKRGANVEAPGSAGWRPLHFAVKGDCADGVKLLLDAGADINARSNDTWGSALAIAAHDGLTKIVKMLIDRGADIDDAVLVLQKLAGGEAGLVMLKRYERQAREAGGQGKPVMPAVVRSDIDDLPPMRIMTNRSSYAVVMGIENYRQQLPRADFAKQDAQLVTSYLTQVLGYPSENVMTLLNERATNVDLVKVLEKWLPNNADAGSSVFVYFSGHGAPNPTTGDAYIVPYDGDPTYIAETGYSLKRLYETLAKLPAKEVTVALDSCFSGAGGRSVLAKGARPIVLSAENPVLASRNITALSASAGNQISSTYDEKGHGLFTYFLLKGIKEGNVVKRDGSLDITGLYDYVKPQVSSIARKKYNNEQTPQLIGAKNK